MTLPALKKCYCYICNKWLINQSLDEPFEHYIHDHPTETIDMRLVVVGEKRLDK